MKSKKNVFKVAPVFVLLLVNCLDAQAKTSQAQDGLALSQYVDPFVGTGTFKADAKKDILEDNPGMTHPSPIVPFGMISFGPNTISNRDEQITDKYEKDIGYNYESNRIEGFALTHLNGAGCPNGREMPMLPYVGKPSPAAVHYQHQNEKAAAGFYEVLLENGVRVELTTKTRMAYARFTFKNLKKGEAFGFQFFQNRRANPPGKDEGVLAPKFVAPDSRHFNGWVEGGDFCSSINKYTIFFAGEWSQAGGNLTTDEGTARVNYIADADGEKTIEMKLALSFVSEAGAQLNLAEEKKDLAGNEETFESVRRFATRAWDQALSAIRIETNDIHRKRTFYSALYHAFSQPNIEEDVSGDYRGYDDQIHQLEHGHHHYANYSGWDIYRSEIQLLSVLFKSRASDMAQSLVSAAAECGGIPEWAVHHSDTAVMVGDAGPIILGDFRAFGADQFDLKSALHFMIRNGSDPKSGCNGHPSRPGLNAYLSKGYLAPGEVPFGFVSTTLEYEAADFAISRFAHALGDEETEERFIHQTDGWKKLWWHSSKDYSVGYLRGKKLNGKWMSPFFYDENPTMKDPENPQKDYDQGFVEGTAAQYSLMLPFDYASVIQELGNHEQALRRLDDFFSVVNGGLDAPYMHIGNEPSFSLPWIYLWAQEPARTQEVVHRILETSFFDVPGGLPGNDDLGATSSWYVFAAIGLYPVIPGEGMLAIHSPYFSEIELNLEEGKSIQIHSEGFGHYIESLQVNEKSASKPWLYWDELKEGGSLNFHLVKKPTSWGSAPEAVPPSFSPSRT